MNKETLKESLKAAGEMWLKRAEEVTDKDVILEHGVIMRDGTGIDENQKEYYNLTLYLNTYNKDDLENFREMIKAFTRSRKEPKKIEWEKKD